MTMKKMKRKILIKKVLNWFRCDILLCNEIRIVLDIY